MRFIVYLLRWQVSGVVMMPVLAAFSFGVVVNVVIAQFVGALIFYGIDSLIFRKKECDCDRTT